MEISLKGQDYRLSKLSVFDQLKVTRKLLPMLAGMLSDVGDLKSIKSDGAMQALPKIADAIAALPDDDVNAIIHPCLAVVARKHDKAWTPVFSQGELMFDDIDLFTMLSLVARVVADSLGNFLHELPDSATATPTAD
ncbi:hypothetical protein J5069_07400 [Candidatus Symbiopectobacterium sp. NZEC127]|uniref:phage tail assembly chaperone n=1 Tax=Candidatus Symbiopectobacterium sp. NZEC127 TaxID=2820472 RepID=UPI002227E286|nr:hypothetical protein [Candidatus Symbiopectobacterium sp. NZEC127]MCW2485721.1 hypothetical protein [Candidatus Symbiopectobacterium sp. NZEC127]